MNILSKFHSEFGFHHRRLFTNLRKEFLFATIQHVLHETCAYTPDTFEERTVFGVPVKLSNNRGVIDYCTEVCSSLSTSNLQDILKCVNIIVFNRKNQYFTRTSVTIQFPPKLTTSYVAKFPDSEFRLFDSAIRDFGQALLLLTKTFGLGCRDTVRYKELVSYQIQEEKGCADISPDVLETCRDQNCLNFSEWRIECGIHVDITPYLIKMVIRESQTTSSVGSRNPDRSHKENKDNESEFQETVAAAGDLMINWVPSARSTSSSSDIIMCCSQSV